MCMNVAGAYGCRLSSNRFDEWKQGFSLCCFNGENPLVNGEPVREERWRLTVEQLSGMLGESCFDASSADCIFAALAREHFGSIVLMRIGENDLTEKGRCVLLETCRNALKMEKKFFVVACAQQEKNPLCCFVVSGEVVFSCWFTEKEEGFSCPLSTSLKGTDMDVDGFLRCLADCVGSNVVVAPSMNCVYSGKEGGSNLWFRVVALFVLLAEIGSEDVEAIRKGNYSSLEKDLRLRRRCRLSMEQISAKSGIENEKMSEVSDEEEAKRQYLHYHGGEVAMERVVEKLKKSSSEQHAQKIAEGIALFKQIGLQEQAKKAYRLMGLYQFLKKIGDLMSRYAEKQSGDDGVRNTVALSAEDGKQEACLLALAFLTRSS